MELSESTAREFSVVVVGNMNPAIHHPMWYIGEVPEFAAEAEASLSGNSILTAPNFAKFATQNITVECQMNRWLIAASSSEKFELALHVAQETFRRLYETPVTAFGFNFDFRGPVGKASSALRELSSTLAFAEGFQVDTLSFRSPARAFEEPDGTSLMRAVTARLADADRDEAVVRVNVHYTVAAGSGKFDLSALMGRASADASEAEFHVPKFLE
ncbi:MAG: hypothetical protein H6718_18235 [Polyangiaceae bacterium]|nr:hypothetical protein [Myxococcales bacterium]MCB9587345.1 hypothetical protein [Polyangiaceae bacterium]MCB9605859.1 hypothetical protein [Polyangiaceae bacterium]